MSKKFAVFDIDGTLIRWQLYHVIVDKLASNNALGKEAKTRLKEARMIWKRREHPDAFKSYEKMLITIYEQALQNIPTELFDSIVMQVIDEYKEQTYVYTRELLKDLKKQDYFTLIISGSHHEIIEQIGVYYGFDDWIGSRYERKNGTFSGEKHIASHDKAAGLRQLIDTHELSLKGSIAVGDSASDIAMMEMVEQPIAFNPDKLLYDAAVANGWKIVVERKNMVYDLSPQNGRYILG